MVQLVGVTGVHFRCEREALFRLVCSKYHAPLCHGMDEPHPRGRTRPQLPRLPIPMRTRKTYTGTWFGPHKPVFGHQRIKMSDNEEKKRVEDPEDEEEEEESDDEEEGSGEDEGESDSEFDDPPDYVDDITDEGRYTLTHTLVLALGGANDQG